MTSEKKTREMNKKHQQFTNEFIEDRIPWIKKSKKNNTTKNQPKKVTMRIHNECVLQTHVTNKNT